MPSYLVTRTETYEIEADSASEAEAVVEELRDIAPPDTEAVSVEIIKGITS